MGILLTGAGGFLGTALLPLLAAQGAPVRALYRSEVPQALPSGVEALQGDLCDPALCARACTGVDLVINLAALAHTHGSAADHERGSVLPLRTLAAAAQRQGVRHFIHVSSTKANYPAHSPYAAARLAAEEFLLGLHARGELGVSCLRPALVYGPGMRGNLATLLRVLRRRHLPLFPASSQPLGMISQEDCCRAILSAARQPAALAGRCWELHDGQVYTLDTLVAEVRTFLGLAPPLLHIPSFCVRLAAWLAGITAPLTGSALGRGTLLALYAEPYRGDDSFNAVTGFRPQHTFHTLLPVLMESIA